MESFWERTQGMRTVKGSSFFGFETFSTDISRKDIVSACEGTRITYTSRLFYLEDELCGAIGRTSCREKPEDFLLSYGIRKLDKDLLSIMRKAQKTCLNRQKSDKVAWLIENRETLGSKRRKLRGLYEGENK